MKCPMKQPFTPNPNMFDRLLEHLHEGIIVHNPEGKILYANPAAHRILESLSDTIIGNSLSSFHPLFSSISLDNTEPVQICLLSGCTQWIAIHSVFTNDDDQNSTIIFNDVTEHKKALEKATLFESAVESIDVGITLADPNQNDTPLIYANPAFLEKTGYAKEEVIGRNCRFLQGDSRDQSARETIRNAIHKHTSTQTELLNYTKSGEPFYNFLTLSPVYLDNELRYFVGVQHDITPIKRQEEKLREQAQYIQTIIDAQEDIIIATNGKRIVYANKALLDFFGYPTLEPFIEESECICDRFIPDEHFFHLGKVGADELWVNTLMRLEEKHRIVIMESAEEITHYFKATVIPFNDSHYIVSFHDVSATLLKEEILLSKAYHDPLTQAYNRQYFYEYVAKWVRKSTKYSSMGIILLDLDNFKSINDTYGHLVGDEVLISTAKVIQTVTRTGDPVARWGGEEFIVLLELESRDALYRVAETIRSAIANTHIDEVGYVTGSVGITIMDKSEPLEIAIKRADDALYRAKKEGKNRVIAEF